jgi:dihydrofolate reductase
MRTLVVCTIASLDGFTAGPGGDVTALPFDDGFNDYGLERLRAADTLLSGRTSFEDFHAYWPSVADDPAHDATEQEISQRHDAARKVVVSDTLTLSPDAPWASSTTVVPRAEAHATVSELVSGEGGEILVFGSGTVWNDLLAAGLVDELHVLVGPALLGAGQPLFTGPPTPLRLLETRPLPGSSLVLQRYGTQRPG